MTFTSLLFRPLKLLGIIAVAFALCGFGSSEVRFESMPVFDESPAAEVSATLTLPGGDGPFPAVVLLHTCGGVTDVMTRFWPKYLAQLGYVSLTVDSLSTRGMRNCRQARSRAEMRQMVGNDAYGALRFLAGRPDVDKQRIGVMGFSLGGIAISAFQARDFKTLDGLNFRAAISLYGHCSSDLPGTPAYPGNPKFPWLIAIGGKERESNLVACRSIQNRPGVTFTLIEGAYHAFDDPRNRGFREDGSGNVMLYSEPATRKAQELTKDFFALHLAKQAP